MSSRKISLIEIILSSCSGLEPTYEDRKVAPLATAIRQPKKASPSKTSIASTGSDYYAALFKDGKVKVGSISQYGSLLKQREDNPK